MVAGTFKNIRVYCGSLARYRLDFAHSVSHTGLAFIVYWGIILFGYDTYVLFIHVFFKFIIILISSGIAGGVVSQPFFQQHFGMLNPDGTKNAAKVDEVSANVVSVLQAGAFFGALGSAPISCMSSSSCIKSYSDAIFS